MPKGIPKNGVNRGWFKKKIRKSFVCKNCKIVFQFRSPRVFCKMECLLEWRKFNPSWNKGIPNTWSQGYKKGNIPWNKGLKRLDMTGESHPNWKGGKPKCVICQKQLDTYGRKKCSKCYLNFAKKENHPNWKGGINNVIKRRAILAGAIGLHNNNEWENLKKKFNYMCLCCKKQEPFIKLTEDHIIPLSRGGSNDISNIQPLCRSCNSIKHTKTTNFIKEIYESRT